MSGMRTITASEDLATLIDRGADVDIELKNLTVEGEGIKTKLKGIAEEEMAEEEKGVRLSGVKAAAVVSATEKMTVNAASESFPKLKESLDNGLLTGVVTCKKNLVVPPDDITRAADLLRENGIGASVVETMEVKAADVRAMRESESSSIEEVEARKALEGCLKTKVTLRLSYERLEEVDTDVTSE